MRIQIIQIFFIVAVYAIQNALQDKEGNVNKTQVLLQQLIDVDRKIDQLVKKDQYFHFQFNRLFENSFQSEAQQLKIADVEIVPSISIPYKDNFYYTIMIKRNLNYYTLRGDLLYQGRGKCIVVATARNQYTYFLEILQNRTVLFNKLRVSNKKAIVEYQHSLHLGNYSDFQINSALLVHQSNQKTFIFVDKRGRIAYFDKENMMLKEIIVKDRIIQVEKVSQNIVVLTEKELFFLNLNKNSSRIDCLLPEGSIDQIKHQDSNFRYFYGIKQGYMYQYQLVKNCRPIKSFYIPSNSSVFLASNFAFIESKANHYALNLSSEVLKPYILPIPQCVGESKLNVVRKSLSNYVIGRLCQKNGQLNISFILVELQMQDVSVADYSKFRIPLLLFSFGVIIYVTVKNKKKQSNESGGEQQLKKKLLGKMTEYKTSMEATEEEEVQMNQKNKANTGKKQPKNEPQAFIARKMKQK